MKANKKPFYRKWWFWVIVAFVTLLIIGALSDGDEMASNGTPTPSPTAELTPEPTVEPTLTPEPTVEPPTVEPNEDGFNEAIAKLIAASEGVVVSIEAGPLDEWDSAKVTLSDDWYYAEEYEKERFVEQVGDAISNVIRAFGMSDSERVLVYFYDTYEKELAEPKFLGGYKLK